MCWFFASDFVHRLHVPVRLWYGYSIHKPFFTAEFMYVCVQVIKNVLHVVLVLPDYTASDSELRPQGRYQWCHTYTHVYNNDTGLISIPTCMVINRY